MILSKKRITKALIRLLRCAGWSAPVLFANPRRQVFSRRGPYIAHMLLFLEHGSKSRCWCKCTESILSNEEPQYGAVFTGVSSYQYLPSGECQLHGVRVHLAIDRVRHCRNTLTASRRIPSNELVSILVFCLFCLEVIKLFSCSTQLSMKFQLLRKPQMLKSYSFSTKCIYGKSCISSYTRIVRTP